jgi:glycine betaine/proline transport system ATP-binding protein
VAATSRELSNADPQTSSEEAAVRIEEAAVRIESVFKIFGPNLKHAADFVRQGQSFKELMERGYVVALRDISISVKPGEIYVVMGLSGSGKSTLVRCVNRLIDPTSGSIWIGGRDITKLSQSDLRKLRTHEIAMVFQKFALFPHMNVLDNVAFGLRVMGINKKVRRQKAAEVLELVGLAGWADKRPRQLSGGMQQRVGLARALAINPPILLMDEPFGSLDPLIRDEMQHELLELQRRLNKTIIFITHDLAEAVTLGDRISILREGQIVQEDTPARIVLQPANPYVAGFVHDMNLLNILTGGEAADLDFPVIGEHQLQTVLRTAGPAIVLDNQQRPVAVYEKDVSGGGSRRILVKIPAGGILAEHLEAIAAADRIVVAVDSEGRFDGVLSGQSILRAIVKAKQKVASASAAMSQTT